MKNNIAVDSVGAARPRPGRDPEGRVFVTMRSGARRALALPAEVPGLLDFAVRVRPDGTPFPSVSAHGLWSCVGSKSEFADWFKERFWRLTLREGIDVIPAPPGSDGVHHVDIVAAVMLVNGSTAEAGRAAADFLERMRRDLSDRLENAAAVGPFATAARAVAPPVPPPLPDGRSLDVVRRIVGTESVAVVSAREIHALVDPTRQFATWWRRIVKVLALDSGEDYADVVPGRLSSGDHGRSVVDYWLPLRVARKACAGMPPAARDPLVAHLLAWSMALPPGPAWPSSPPAAVHAIPALSDDPSADGAGDSEAESAEAEPWAEAFEFGRLVPVADREVGGVMQPTVSARDVHTFLGFSRKFTDWFNDQVSRCSLVADLDYRGVFHLEVKNPLGGRPRVEFVLTLDAAKKLGMVASGCRGNAVREYFIECERRLLAGEAPIPSAPPRPPVRDDRASPAVAVLPDTAYQPSMCERSIPLTMPAFLRHVGMSENVADAVAAANEGVLLRAMLSDGLGPLVGHHPVDRRWLVFDRKALDAWWSGARVALLADPAALVALR